MREDIKNRIFFVIAKTLNKEPGSFEMETKIEDLSKDSIELFQLILAFQKEFGSEAEYEELMQIETVGDIVAYVKKKTS